MSKFTTLLPKILLWILMAISVVAIVLVFAGGSVDPTAEYKEPVYTDLLLYWIGIIVIVALVITLGFAFVNLCKNLIKHPVEALKSLAAPLLLIGLLVFGYLGMNNYCYMGNDEIPTFDGVITMGMNQLTNMCMLGIAALTVVAIVLIILSGLFKAKVREK